MGKGTDLVPDDKGTDKDECDGREKDDGGDDSDGFEHLQRVRGGQRGDAGLPVSAGLQTVFDS